jgi:5-formyltetrahydrofolate cyclo-ligase
VPNPIPGANKDLLRRQCRRISVPDSHVASLRIVDNLTHLLQTHPEWQRIALFAALPREPDLRSLPVQFPERSFFYPRVTGQEMTFHQVTDAETQLLSGAWGLSEPSPSLPEILPQDLDLILCPGMAFTLDGKRLGKGGGFYDRYLAPLHPTPPCCIGVTFAAFLLDDIPTESHDFLMNAIVCENTVSPRI